MSSKRGSRLPPAGRVPPHLTEFTIRMGDADLYVNLDRAMQTDADHILYEAVLSDAQGSRMIYVEREELAECLTASPILHPEGQPEADEKPRLGEAKGDRAP